MPSFGSHRGRVAPISVVQCFGGANSGETTAGAKGPARRPLALRRVARLRDRPAAAFSTTTAATDAPAARAPELAPVLV